MSNYTTENLISVTNPAHGIPAIRIGDQVFPMVTSGGVDVGSTTAEAGDVLSGKVFYNSGGVQTSGTIPTVSATSAGSQITVPAGYIASSQTFTISSGGIDVSSTTAEAPDVLDGKVFYDSAGTFTIGTIPTVSASLSANVTTVPAGYIASSQTLTVPEASSATVSGGIVTIPQGYVSSAYTVSAGGGSVDFYKCASVTSGGSTWTGYLATLSNGKYTFASSVTSGLSYGSGFTPAVNKIYDNGALVQVAELWDGISRNGLIRYAPMSAPAVEDELRNALSTAGNPTFAIDSGIPCAAMDSGSYIGYSEGIAGLSAYTLSIWMKRSSSGDALMTFSGGNYGYGGDELWLNYNADGHIGLTNGGAEDYQIMITENTFTGWRHLCIVWTGTAFRLYVDGVQQGSDTSTEYNYYEYSYLYAYINSLQRATSAVTGSGKYAAFRLYNRVLDVTEIAALAAEFTPSA